MTLPVTIPNTFANATTSIPLANLDANFVTIYDAVNGIGNGAESLANVSITGGTASNVTVEFAAGTNTAPSITTVGDTNTGIFFPAADTIAFAEGGAEAMRIDSSGNVGINTTSPAAKLDVLGNARVKNNNGCTVENAAGNYRQMYMSGADYYFFNGTNQAYLSSAGSWTNASDARLKTNIREIEHGLNTVVATQPRHFERVDVDGTYIGFIAQELQQVIPEVVMGDPEKQLGVDYGSLVAVAFKAIQELSAKNDALEARIAALEAVPGNE